MPKRRQTLAIFEKQVRMKYSAILLLAGMAFFSATLEAQPSRRCLSLSPSSYMQGAASKNAPASVADSLHAGSTASPLSTRAVVKIPVVVHVVWNKTEENISDEQIFSQIEVLNRDFRATNLEIPDIPAIFQNRIADVEFEFCLASVTPDDQPTSGITRTFTNNSVGIGGTKAIHYTNLGGKDAWDAVHYLNIWVAKFAGGVGGVATFPGTSSPAEDGVQIDYRQFGTFNVQPPYHLGRTCTHEIGHYFNLEHVWGPNLDSCCEEDDFVADTPNACESYLHQCPVHPVFSCAEPDMFMNFMFYTDDACMGMFTKGQKMRMWDALSQYRPGLLNSTACEMVPTVEEPPSETLSLYGNPVQDRLLFEIKSKDSAVWKVQLSDLLGRRIFYLTCPANLVQSAELPSSAAGVFFLEAVAGDRRIVAKVAVF